MRICQSDGVAMSVETLLSQFSMVWLTFRRCFRVSKDVPRIVIKLFSVTTVRGQARYVRLDM
jgi:hypothetical protein